MTKFNRCILRGVLSIVCLWLTTACCHAQAAEERPNFVIIFADDLGYGDLACFGHPTIHTPHLDRMAREGMKFTQFYSAASVCTPSRAALLTGRLPARSGMCSNRRRVLFPDSLGGLPADEITLAEALKSVGYATACVGKWHLGHLPKYLPTRHGFDRYFGIPYSNDMRPTPLLRGEDEVEEPADQTTLTRRYTDEAVKFIRENQEQPFFLYFPHSFPHVPLFASDDFLGKSRRGLYGDVVEELDASVGRILSTLRDLDLDEKTLVIFTSDNGPWLTQDLEGGTAGLLRDGKGSTWEGGMREPTLAWWPSRIEAGRVERALASTMDLFATFSSLANVPLPNDRSLDSYDLSPLLFESGESARETLFYYRGYQLMAVRRGPWKAHFITQTAYRGKAPVEHNPPLLFHLEHDPREKFNVAEKHPEILALIQNDVRAHRATLDAAPSQLELR